jgi:hypothetical protein
MMPRLNKHSAKRPAQFVLSFASATEVSMKRMLFKVGLFICIWYELAAELHMSGDAALVWGIVVWCVGSISVRLASQAIGLLGPGPVALLFQTLVWLVLFFWQAPAFLRAQSFVTISAGVVAIALAGAGARKLKEAEYRRYGKGFWHRHSAAAVLTLFGTLGLCTFSLRQWGSLWPLIGYFSLFVIPFNIGWRRVSASGANRADAKVGDAGSFRDAGLSDER